MGQEITRTLPYFSDAPMQLNITIDYDELHRKKKTNMPDGSDITYSYNPKEIVTIANNNNIQQQSKKTFNPLGQILQSEDNNQTIVNYSYYSSGLLHKSWIDGFQPLENVYDIQGNRESMFDTNAGLITSQFDAFGRLVQHINAKGEKSTLKYDKLNRVIERKEVDESDEIETTTVWQYDNKPKGKGKLSLITNSNNHKDEFFYDNLGRLRAIDEITDNFTFSLQYQYDNLSRVNKIIYPEDYSISYSYQNGQIKEIRETATNQILWKGITQDNFGNFTSTTCGNLNNTKIFDDLGKISNIRSQKNTNFVQNWHYQYDEMNNIKSRTDYVSQQDEVFWYDDLNRLRGVGWLNEQMQHHIILLEMDYDLLGNIKEKSDVGDFDYDDSNKPNAVTQIIPFNNYTVPDHNIEYYVNGRTKSIEDSDNNRINFVYGPNKQRRKVEYFYNNDLQTTTYYALGNYEEVRDANNNVTKYYYIGSPDGLVAMRKVTNGTPELYFILTDHLGSIEALTDENGDVVERYSYDAWGNRRHQENWFLSDTRTNFITNRGFTGHEHLDVFGLINANARMYEPATGRFLTPDPYIQAPDFSQNYNRYAYCWNNPLKYTDPSGDFIWAIAAFIVVGGYDLLTNNWQGWEGSGKPAVMAGLGGLTSGGNMAINGKNLLKYSSNIVGNKVLGQYMPGVGVSFGNFSISATPGFGFGLEGLYVGGHLTAMFDDGTTSIYGSVGAGTNIKYAYGYGGTYKGWGAGRYYTSYGDKIGPDGKPNPQVVGGLNIYGRIAGEPASIRIENDFLSGTGDKWRSNAIELSWSKYSIGTNLYNNDPAGEGLGQDLNGTDRRGNLHPLREGRYNRKGELLQYSAWKNGQTYYSPLWFGIRNGNTINRIGFSHPSVQDVTQNNVHRLFPPGYQNYYNKYGRDFYQGPTNYSGYYNPFSLW
jgi:RHS repeat-associated protein